MKLRRAIFIYVGTIVLPVCGLLWLGVQSFERQRESLATLQGEKLTAEVTRREVAAAEAALRDGKGPVVRHFFRMERGRVVWPALTAPLPDPLPATFRDADLQEANHPDVALQIYRKLFASGQNPALALSRIARCLDKLGMRQEARAVWRKLTSTYPDERDLAHRPYGIVAAIAAGETSGLYEQIAAGRWELAAEQAEHFLGELDPDRTTPYLEQFRFARALQEGFHPQAALRDDQLYSYALGDYRVYFRSAAERIEGLAVDDGWVQRTLRPQVEEAMGMTVSARQQTVVYGGAIALVLVILSAGVALLFRDVTRESRTNQLRADFVSSVSHELKTPITLIRLYGDTLLERGELSASERAEFYRIIVRESERLTRLINQILTFSRIERGVEEYALEVGDLGRAVGRIMDDYEEYLQQAGFAMHREMATSLPPTRFDAIAVFQAVANLMDNAVKYSGESREITVRLGAREGGVVFEVEDKGIGIPSTEQMKIFDRFYRVQNGSGKGGYGLGLFLVRHVMEAHAGRVEVQSEVRRGSCFRLVFPLVTSS